jgi:hypothetical protein
LLLSFVLGLVLLGGLHASYRGYKAVRQARLVNQARKSLAKFDPHQALLYLQLALRYNNRDVEACRLMAQLAEAGHSPAALVWRSRVVELIPGSTDDRLALALTAMTARDYTSATNALEGVDGVGKKTAAYHNVAGTLAGAVNQSALAEAHFLEAARLEPQNAFLQLNLAVVRLRGTNSSSLAEARRSLQQISDNPTNSTLRCQALRELTIDSLRAQKMQAALALSRQLLQETNSIFRDRLLRLDVLRETKSAEFKPALVSLQREASTEPGRIAEFGRWQMANTTPAETLLWLHKLPAEMQTNLAVAVITAEVCTALCDWSGLQTAVEKQNWGELDFVQHAFTARALRGQEFPGAAKGEWELALKAANSQSVSLGMLLRLAAAWNWKREEEEVLWSIVNRHPAERWAFAVLNQALFAGGRTRQLMMLYRQELKRSPANLGIMNNLAMTALLLGANELMPHDLAREVYKKAPTNAAFASTYAFSLHLQDKNADALKVFQTLKSKQLEDLRIAGYYGLILNATGDKSKAQAYLDSAFKSPMLPEERRLFERAKTGI